VLEAHVSSIPRQVVSYREREEEEMNRVVDAGGRGDHFMIECAQSPYAVAADAFCLGNEFAEGFLGGLKLGLPPLE
jgi:hypothetical protein